VNSAYDHRFVGSTASAQCGLWGANAGATGDIDGAGLDDVQLSCPYSSAASSSAGDVHLYLTP